jgi:serine protease Do
VQVPLEWSDIETGAWTFRGKNAGVFLAASSDLANFYATRSQPGVLIGVSRSLAHTYNKEGLLGLEKRDFSRQCVHKGRFDYKNQFYSGQYDHFANCASGTPGLFVFTTTSADKKSLIMIRITAVSEADLEAVDTIINTFQVLGDPERDEHHDE